MLSCKRKKRCSAIKRIRAKFGSKAKNELLVFCSSRNIYAQVVDLDSGATRFTVSTCKNGDKKNHRNIKLAMGLGKDVAVKCKEKGIVPKDVVFNRAEKIFHGVVKAVADGFYQD